jgi:L-rhamnonate dehydratase
MDNPRLTRIEVGYLHGERPRDIGYNARLTGHGKHVREPFARLTFEDGSSGFGRSTITQEQAKMLLGRRLLSLISLDNRVTASSQPIEFPLWDTLAKRAGKPVYRLLAGDRAIDEPFAVPCYDTSLYFDDLHLADDKAAVELIASEARDGYERGHRAFKIKIGRGAMHMPLTEGTTRDIAIIHGVGAAVGADCPLMIDANNGYNVNLVKWVLTETADCNIFWMEEPFYEDRVLYDHLHIWLKEQGFNVLLADGEGQPHPNLLDWARDGAVDVVQYNFSNYGISQWLTTGRQLDSWGVKTAPHNYGSAFGDYASGHLAAGIGNFAYVEWDHIDMDGLDTSGYRIQEGRVHIPDAPGFGLGLDENIFRKSVESEGFYSIIS